MKTGRSRLADNEQVETACGGHHEVGNSILRWLTHFRRSSPIRGP